MRTRRARRPPGRSLAVRQNMKAILIALGIIVALAAVVLFLRSRIAESGTHREVAARLTKLKQNPARDAFLGLCTRNEDALYFVFEGGTFFLDYELSDPEKKPFEAPFRAAARELGLPVVDTTYGQFLVLRVNAGAAEDGAALIGFRFAQKVFGHDDKTVIEFLP